MKKFFELVKKFGKEFFSQPWVKFVGILLAAIVLMLLIF